MPGFTELLTGAVPIAGGAVLGVAARNLKGPDVRGLIKQDQDLRDGIPPDQKQRRAELQSTIDLRIDGLVAGINKSQAKSQALREAVASYDGSWRDILMFVCAISFTYIWWGLDHSKSNWLPMFIVMIVLSVFAGVYAARGMIRAASGAVSERRRGRDAGQDSAG